MKHPFIVLVVASVASMIFIGWRVHVMGHHPVNLRDVVYDPSLSFTGGCKALVGSANVLLREPGVSPGGILSVLALGDASTADEPRRVATYPIPEGHKVIEGRGAAAERRQKVLRDLWAKCTALDPTLITPIYLGAQKALADLRAKGCKASGRCSLWVATDLAENADRAIAARLRSYRKSKVPLPPALDNRGIEVTFCGYAQTAGRILGPSGKEIGRPAARDPHQDNRLQAVWQALFTRPQLVKFEPYCPQPDNRILRVESKLNAPLEARQ